MNMRKTFAMACAIAASLTQAIELDKGLWGTPTSFTKTVSKTIDDRVKSEIVSLMMDNFSSLKTYIDDENDKISGDL